RTAVVTAPLYRAQVSSQGGRLDAWDLDYRGVKPMVVKGQFGPKGLEVIRPAGAAAIVAFNLSPESLALGSTGSKGELKLTGEDGYGLRVTETLKFHADSYVAEHLISVQNQHSVPQSAELRMTWVAPVEWPKNEEQKFTGQHPIRTVRLLNGSATREVLE